ncbi:hypothetical protein ABFA07_004772 [Porites harrisoni]
MMKKLSLLLLFGLISATFANKIADNRNREKRFLFGQCQVDSDCGAERCCSVFETCHDKRGLDQSCNFVGLHKCGCKSGLSCQPVYQIGSLNVYHRCRPIPTEEPGSGDI